MMKDRCSNCGKKWSEKTPCPCTENKNTKMLGSFVEYCCKHRNERFWQALRNWSGNKFIYVCNDPSGEGESDDTFYWKGKRG